MALHAYKFVNTHYHEILGCKFLSILLHAHAPNILGMNCDVHYDIATLALNKRETLKISYHNYQTSTRNYPLWRKCLSYKNYIKVHEGISK